ncbi:sugar transferase [Palleronia marisminoris]|uniref:sugar transferase n=1 Tax=Palleronia marisminoris TaxID=315423 RepID=UPI0023EA6BFD|nr:sugar transferase [Palleronia marisminoris]
MLDILLSAMGLALLWPIICVTAWLAARDTGASGIFAQTRVGREGRPFTLYKIRTMIPNAGGTVTAKGDARITSLGQRLRQWKLDELPQLWNVLTGDMSLVGPRPDVPGYADTLEGEARALLTLRPGITGPATLKYRDEEDILARVADPRRYNDTVIWPDKVRLNLEYLHRSSIRTDIRCILLTLQARKEL